MEIFKIWAIAGFIFLFAEIAAPSMFFLPLGGAAFFAAVAAFKCPDDYWIQAGVFALFAVIFFFTVRPFMAQRPQKQELTGVEVKYIGQDALVIKDIGIRDSDGVGVIKIYGETWQAKSSDGQKNYQARRVDVDVVRGLKWLNSGGFLPTKAASTTNSALSKATNSIT